MAEAMTDPMRLPAGPRLPKAAVGLGFLAGRHRALTATGRRYGAAFSVELPIFGDAIVISDRDQIRELFTTNSELVARGERRHSRGVATAPAAGGRAVVFRRSSTTRAHNASDTQRPIGPERTATKESV